MHSWWPRKRRKQWSIWNFFLLLQMDVIEMFIKTPQAAAMRTSHIVFELIITGCEIDDGRLSRRLLLAYTLEHRLHWKQLHRTRLQCWCIRKQVSHQLSA